MKLTLLTNFARVIGFISAATAFTSCSSTKPGREVLVSLSDQKVALRENGKTVRVYQCSTSKFGIGDRNGSNCTPEGKMVVASKIGSGARPGTVFKGRRPTGEVIPPNAPGRDPIVSRILWLSGRESKNARAYGRCIYIHGTPEEARIGAPASYGCVRMRSMDIIDLFDKIPVGTPVTVSRSGLPMEAKMKSTYVSRPFPMPANAPVYVQRTTPAPTVAAISPRKYGPEVPAHLRSKKTVR